MLWHLSGLRCQIHTELEKKLIAVQGKSEEGASWGQSSSSLQRNSCLAPAPNLQTQLCKTKPLYILRLAASGQAIYQTGAP